MDIGQIHCENNYSRGQIVFHVCETVKSGHKISQTRGSQDLYHYPG
jgi:hypothetical protein